MDQMSNGKGNDDRQFKLEEQTETMEEQKSILSKEAEPMTKPRILLLNLSWLGLSLMFLLLSVEVVPAQIHSLVGDAVKGRWLGGMVAAGAAVTFISSPLIGMKSDRLTFQTGRRRPVMVAGTLALCVGLAGMALSAPKVLIEKSSYLILHKNSSSTGQCERDLLALRCRPYWNASEAEKHRMTLFHNSHPASVLIPAKKTIAEAVETEIKGSIFLYMIFYLLVTFAFATITVPYNALIADKSHPSQRGFSSGVMGAMILLGNVSGAAVGTCFTEIGVLGAYGTAIAVVMISVTITVVTTTEDPGKQQTEPLDCKTVIYGFWQPLKEHDFRWVFITRFLMQQGVSTVTGFLEYWLSDMVHLPNCLGPTRAVAIMLIPLLFAACVSSVIFGFISDRFGRRKILVTVAAFLMCCCTSSLIFIDGHAAFFVAVCMAFLFGIGFGTFQSVDFALVMDVLPDEKDKAKDIAVWHQALVLPNAIATPIGGIILDGFESVNCEIGLGYIILFSVTMFYFFLSAIFVSKIQRAN